MGTPNSALAAITTKLGTTFWIAVGTGTAAFAATDTTLGTEIADSGLARAAATVTQQTTTVANDTLQYAKTFTASGSKAVSEAGVLDAASAGNMYGRTVLSSVRNVVSGDTLSVTYKTIFARPA